MEKDTQKVSRSTAVTDEDLIRKIQETGDNDSYLELRERYQKAFYSMCHRYIKSCKSIGINEEDILSELDYVLFSSARTFDFSRKLKFSTWISNQTRYFCLNSMRKRKKTADNFNFFIEIKPSEEGDEGNLLEREEFKAYQKSTNEDKDEVRHILSAMKDSNVIEILRLRYQDRRKTPWALISKKMKLQYNDCKFLHDTAINNFRLKMNILPREASV